MFTSTVFIKTARITHKSFVVELDQLPVWTSRRWRERRGVGHFQNGILVFFFFTNKNRAKTRRRFLYLDDLAAEWIQIVIHIKNRRV